jgi:subtilisin family serine protease
VRTARCFVATVLAAGLISPAATAHAEPSTTAPPAKTQTITLISGDKVVVNERGELAGVQGRPGMRFAQYVQDGQQYVVPADAVDAVGQDRVDKRFFNVTALHSFGYTDDKIDRIPVLDNGFRAAAAVPKKEAEQRWKGRANARGAGKLWLNGKAKISLDQSVPMVGAPAAWQSGFDGTGVTVAVLDTGYDQNHPELAGAVAVSKDFTPAASRTTSATARTSPRRSRDAARSTPVWRRARSSRSAGSARGTGARKAPSWPAWTGPRARSGPRSST